MELTPIRVRGKRKPKRPAGDGSETSSVSSLESGPRKKKYRASPGHSSRASSTMLSPLSSPLPAHSQQTAPRSNNRPRPILIDRRFPLEILERIYLLSENVNLARCSKRMGWLLSSRRTRMEMVVAAFGPTWDQFFGRTPGPTMTGEVSGNPRFQSSILACPWVNASLLLDAQQLWLRRQKEDRRYDHLLREEGEETLVDIARSLSMDLGQVSKLQQAHPSIDATHGFRPPNIRAWSEEAAAKEAETETAAATATRLASVVPVTIHACFAREQLFFVQAPCAPESMGPANFETVSYHGLSWQQAIFGHESYRITHRDVHPRARIPERFLLAGRYVSGPLDSARLREAFDSLFWLVKGGAQLQAADSWEATLEGFQNLLQVSLESKDEEDREKKVESEVGGEIEEDEEAGNGGQVRVDFGPDLLVTAIIGLFNSLGVFQRQWPQGVLADAFNLAAERARRDGLFEKSRAFVYIRRIARLCGLAVRKEEEDLGGGYVFLARPPPATPRRVGQLPQSIQNRPPLQSWYGGP